MEKEIKKSSRGKFLAYAIPIVVLLFISQFIYPAIPTDQLNFIFPYLAGTFGWDPVAMSVPMTIGRICNIPFFFLCGTILLKKGPRWFFPICIIVCGLCESILAFVNNFALYCVAAFLLPIVCSGLLIGAFAVVNNWFSKWRGRILGIITLSSPLSSLVTYNVLNKGEQAMGFKTTVLLFSGFIVLIGILSMIIIKERPEAIGCYPDGADEPPALPERADIGLIKDIKLKHLLKHPEIWLHSAAFGLLIFIMGCCCAFFVPTFQAQGYSEGYINILLAGYALLGMGLSFLSGVLDDRFGTHKASLIMGIIFVLGMLGFRLGSVDRPWLTWIGMVALGGMVGSVPNLNPSLIVYTYGRDAYDYVNRVSNALVYVFPCFSVMYFTAASKISYNFAYTGLIIVAVIAFLCLLFIRKKIDLTQDVLADTKPESKE